jgi:hypothetical protein
MERWSGGVMESPQNARMEDGDWRTRLDADAAMRMEF